MRKSLSEAPTFLTIERIASGFLIIDPKANKFHKQTLNGVVKFIEQNWGVKYIYSTEHEEIEELNSAEKKKKKIADEN